MLYVRGRSQLLLTLPVAGRTDVCLSSKLVGCVLCRPHAVSLLFIVTLGRGPHRWGRSGRGLSQDQGQLGTRSCSLSTRPLSELWRQRPRPRLLLLEVAGGAVDPGGKSGADRKRLSQRCPRKLPVVPHLPDLGGQQAAGKSVEQSISHRASRELAR